MRKELLDVANIRCIVDLSAIRVFDDVGAYVVLLVFQKTNRPDSNVPVLAVKCNELAGIALEEALQERVVQTSSYEVYWSGQPRRTDTTWSFSPPEKLSLQSKLSDLPKLGDTAEIRQGLITGLDDVFILESGALPRGERKIYAPFLPDRDMRHIRCHELLGAMSFIRSTKKE